MLLDVGCKDRKQPNFTGIDYQKREGVDIVHDIYDTFPYPLPSESCLTIKAAHVIEHVKPWRVLGWMDEMWRLLLPDGQLAISTPYPGSTGFYLDPTHVTHVTEGTWQMFDPDFPLYQQYRPKPWKIEYSVWKPGGNLEVILRKRSNGYLAKQEGENKSIDLAQKAIMSLGALQKVTELAAFLEFIKDKPLKTVVEIGTARGGVFYCLCQLAPLDGVIVSIDLPGGPFGGGYSLADEDRFRTYRRGKQSFHFLREDSHDEVTKKHLRNILKGGIDLLFIDGDHTYVGVKKDWQMYSPLVKKGGMVVFHDIIFHPIIPECRVDKFWKEIKSSRKTFEFVDKTGGWGGIGVVLK